jgi:hypothetical protein
MVEPSAASWTAGELLAISVGGLFFLVIEEH